MQVVNGKEVFTTLEELVNPKCAALLLIDIQNDYMPGEYLDKVGGGDASVHREIVPRVKRVLDAARSSGVLVVHVQMTHDANHWTESPASLRKRLLRAALKGTDSIEKLPTPCVEGTWGWQIVDELTPLPNEVIIKKNRGTAFRGTNLDILLRSNGVKSVVVVGVVTSGCVMATANDASWSDYYTVILRDCVASCRTQLHESALLIMADRLDVVDSEDVLAIWK